MQFLRKLAFYIFVTIYVVFCPLILLYAFGYIFKPGAENNVEKTGLIYLSTAPSGATVYMDSSRYTQTTPTVIRDLLPGSYSIRLVMDDYRAWKRAAPVEVSKATVFDKILLLPDRWEEEKVLAGKFDSLIPADGSGFFLLSKRGPAKNIFVFNYSSEEAHPLFKDGSSFAHCKARDFFTVPGSLSILLELGSPDGRKYVQASLGADSDEAADITNLLQTPPREIKWLPDKKDQLFTFQDGYLNKIDISSGAVYPEIIGSVKGYGLFDGEIYVLKEDNRILTTDLDGQAKRVILDDPKLGGSIFGEKETFDIQVVSGEYILFLGEKGQLLANRLPYTFVEKGVRGLAADQAGERVLIWTRNRIGILDFSAEETENTDFEKGPGLTWVYTAGKNIEQCFWVYEGAYILFLDGNSVFIVEIDDYGQFVVESLFELKGRGAAYYSEQSGKLYFIDPSVEGLLSAEIVPVKSIIPQPFPELGGKSGDTGQE